LHGQRTGAALADVPRQVLAESTASVLMVRRGGIPTVQLCRLLVPVDNSPGDSPALAAAVALARDANAMIRVLEVVDRGPPTRPVHVPVLKASPIGSPTPSW
jgi:nucleotide-binding universal stress UspA family protein